MFKLYQVNLVNAIVLVAMGLWGFLEKSAPTALIAVFVGAILWIYTNKLKDGNKNVAHGLVILTLLMLLGTLMPLRRELKMDDTLGVFRSVTMLLSCAVAMYFFIQSFREARQNRINN